MRDEKEEVLDKKTQGLVVRFEGVEIRNPRIWRKMLIRCRMKWLIVLKE